METRRWPAATPGTGDGDQKVLSNQHSGNQQVAPGTVLLEFPFRGFVATILAPVAGTVVIAHDGEPDHAGRRSQLALVPYMLGQAAHARAGGAALAGNHVVIAVRDGGPFVLLAHVRRNSVVTEPGRTVQAGEELAECGNSGNSTEPHVHVQVSDSMDWRAARGVPLTFRRHDGGTWIPAESEIVTA